MTAATTGLGSACLFCGMLLLAYSAFTDLLDTWAYSSARLWERPVLLLPLALGLIVLGGALLRDR